MKFKRTFNFHIFLLLFLSPALSPLFAFAVEDPGVVAETASIDEHLGETIDLSLMFNDISGKSVALSELVSDDKPFIITPVYYRCPSLCNLTLNGFTKLLNKLELEMGKDFKVLTVSFNPKEDSALAKEKASNYFGALNDSKNAKGNWHFLTGSEENIEKLMGQIGFNYITDKDDFGHQAAIMVLSQKGLISRYFYGIDYPEQEVRRALVQASLGKIGNTLDKVFLYCFRFDPTKGKYSLVVMNLVRIVSVIVLLGLITTLVFLRIKEKSKNV